MTFRPCLLAERPDSIKRYPQTTEHRRTQMMINKMLAAVTVCAAFVVAPAVAGAAPVTRGAGAAYGEHVSTHARDIGGFSGHMNPGDHRGFSGHGEHN
jgi:hypothetical protein